MLDLPVIRSLAADIVRLIDAAAAPVEPPGPEAVADAAELVVAIQDGATDIRLRPGRYGRVTLRNLQPKARVTVLPEEEGQVHLDSLHVLSCADLALGGLLVAPDVGALGKGGHVVNVDHRSRSVGLHGLDVRSGLDVDDVARAYMGWSQEQWLARQVDGVMMAAPGGVVEGCKVVGCYHGVQIWGEGGRSAGNRVVGHSGDAYRLIGDESSSLHDAAEDGFQINGNHMDVLQSWSLGPDGQPGRGVRRGLLVDGLSSRWTGDPDHPLRADMQGVGWFDGPYEDCVVRNCDLDVGSHHGISIYGGVRCRIESNRVYSTIYPGQRNRPWILLRGHKDGRPATDLTATDNTCNMVTVKSDGINLVERNAKVPPLAMPPAGPSRPAPAAAAS